MCFDFFREKWPWVRRVLMFDKASVGSWALKLVWCSKLCVGCVGGVGRWGSVSLFLSYPFINLSTHMC